MHFPPEHVSLLLQSLLEVQPPVLGTHFRLVHCSLLRQSLLEVQPPVLGSHFPLKVLHFSSGLHSASEEQPRELSWHRLD